MYRTGGGNGVGLTYEYIQSLDIKHLKGDELVDNIQHLFYLMKYEDESDGEGICVTDELKLDLSHIIIDEQGKYNCYYDIPRLCDGIVLNKFPQSLTDLASSISICDFIDVQQDKRVFIPLISLQYNICAVKLTTRPDVTLDMIPREINLSTDFYYLSSQHGTKPRHNFAHNNYLFDTNLQYSTDFIRQLYITSGMIGVNANRLPNSNELTFIKRHQLIQFGQFNLPHNACLVYNFSAKLLDNKGNVSDKLTGKQLIDNLVICIGGDSSFTFDEFQSDNALPLGMLHFHEVNIKPQTQLRELLRQGYSLVIEYDEAEFAPPYVKVASIKNDNFALECGMVATR